MERILTEAGDFFPLPPPTARNPDAPESLA
jgi:hypothetical protein